MILAWTFWLLLLVPGAWLHRRLRSATEPASAFETIAVGYALSLLMLAPVCMLGHALELPLSVLSAAIAALVLAGVLLSIRDARAGRIRFRVQSEHVPMLLLVAFVLLQAAAAGGHITNDADFHLARIRFLYDRGLSNADPLTGTGFSHPYHTNLLHALVAAASQITGLDPIAVWQGTLPWAKLTGACGVAVLSMQFGGRALAASASAATFLGSTFRVDWLLYPNQLAMFWLLPLGLGACIGLFATEHRRYYALLIGGTGLLLGLVHGLYAGFFLVLAAPTIAVLTIHRGWSRRSSWRAALQLGLLGAVLLSAPVPSLYIARYAHKPEQANFDYQGGEPTRHKPKRTMHVRVLKQDDAGRFHLRPSRLLGGRAYQALAIAALAIMLVRKRAIQVIAVTITLGTCLAFLHVPALAERAVDVLGAPWMLERVLMIVMPIKLAFLWGAFDPPWPTQRWLARVAGFVPILAAIVATGMLEEGPKKTLHAARKVKLIQVLTAELPRDVAADQALLKAIAPGSIVLTHPLAARQLRKLHHIYFVRASRNHTGVDDLIDRTKDIHTLMYAKKSTDKVKAVLARHRIAYAIQKSNHPIRWLKKQKVVGKTTTLKLIKLK